MIAENTKSVLISLLDDIKRVTFIISCIVQLIFIVFYTYMIYASFDKLIFLITYSLLLLLSLVSFILYISMYKKRKKQNKTFIRFRNFSKYFINFSMIVVVFIQLVKFGIDDFSKILLIVSTISLFIQIIVEFVRMLAERYINDFKNAIHEDFKYFNLKNWKGNLLEFIEKPLGKVANKKLGKEVELTDEEKRLIKYRERAEKLIEDKEIKKAKKEIEEREEEKSRVKEQFGKIKKDLSIIFNKDKKQVLLENKKTEEKL